MSLNEKVAYLKGLAEGIGLDAESKEGKLFLCVIDTLSEMADEIQELSENALDIGEELDAISDDLADVEEFLFDDDYSDDDDDVFDFSDFDDDDDDDDDDFETGDCNCSFCSGDSFSYQIECPNCGVDIEVGEPDLISGSVTCSSCGDELELEFDDDDIDDDDDDDDGDDGDGSELKF